jgi:nucleoside-diphosphate-sugar epimerase
MSIVITGPTGQLGRLVVEQLMAAGTPPGQIVATGRDTEKPTALETEMSDHPGLCRTFGPWFSRCGCRTSRVGEHIVHVHFGPGLEAAHHLAQ